MRLHHARHVGSQRPVPDAIQAARPREVIPVQVTDVTQQVDSVASGEVARECQHRFLRLEHVEPALAQLRQVHRPVPRPGQVAE